MLFASPDFGAGGMAVLLLSGISIVIVVISVAGILRGSALCNQPLPARRKTGVLLIIASLLFPVICFSGPSVLFRLNHRTPPLGRYPNGVILKGMSADEVRSLLGEPHKINDQDPKRVTWLYWLEAIQLDWFMVRFDDQGKVDSTGGS